MIAVIFEVQPHAGPQRRLPRRRRALRPLLDEIDGFISIERFESLTQPGKMLSLSFWRDEEAVRAVAQCRGSTAARRRRARESIFADYRLRVAQVLRDYGMNDRDEAPDDSRRVHDS